MRVAVIGATGFIGTHLCEMCLSRGDELSLLDRNPEAVDYWQEHGASFEVADLTDHEALCRVCADADVVINLAGALGRWRTPPSDLEQVNAWGAGQVVRCAAQSGARMVIHVSTAGVTGPLPDGVCADEEYPCRPASDYQKTKLDGERLALREHEESGIPLTIIRPGFVYGPGDTHKLSLFRAVAGRRMILANGGRSRLHPIYVDDLAQGLLLAARHAPGQGEVYIIAGVKPVTVRSLIETIALQLRVLPPRMSLPMCLLHPMAVAAEAVGRTVGREPPLTRSRLSLFSENYAYSTDKARRELGFKPLVDLPAGVRITSSWYLSKGILNLRGLADTNAG